MDERRTTQRSRRFLGGSIAFNERRSSFDCLVRDLSQDGARICLPSTVGLPISFELTVRATGERRDVQIMWRDHMQAGVRFLDAGSCGRTTSSAKTVLELAC